MNMTCSLAVAGSLLLGLAAPAPADQQYEIRMTRPAKAGQTMQVLGQRTSESTIEDAAGEQVGPASRRTVDFDATAEVIEVDGSGRPIAVLYTVAGLNVTEGGTTRELLPSATRITARRLASGTMFQANGSALAPEIQAELEPIVGLTGAQADPDSVFGTDEPRPVGGRWPVDPEQAAADLAGRIGGSIRGGDLSGTASLVDVREEDGQRCLLVRTRLEAGDVAAPAGAVPSGVRIDGPMRISASYQGIVPLDRELPLLRQTIRVKMEAPVVADAGSDGGPGPLRLEHKQVVRLMTRPLAGAGAVASVSPDAR